MKKMFAALFNGFCNCQQLFEQTKRFEMSFPKDIGKIARTVALALRSGW